MRPQEVNSSPRAAVTANSLVDNTELPPSALKELLCALRDQWKRYRRQLRKCQRKVSERAVHELRVEARRLLSRLHLLSPFLAPGRLAKAEAALKCHLDTFDDLRDTQVQLGPVGKLRKSLSAAGHFYDFLKKREARLSRWTCKHAKRLRAKPLSKLIAACRQDVRGWQKHGGALRANNLLLGSVTRAFDTAKKFRKDIDRDNPHSIHCTRIAFKKFRYMVEALAGCLKREDKLLLERLRQYQGLMGDIQDAHVLLGAFEKFFRKDEIDAKPAAKLTHELLRRRERLIAKYLAKADRLMDFWPPARGTAHVSNHQTPSQTSKRQQRLSLRSAGFRG